LNKLIFSIEVELPWVRRRLAGSLSRITTIACQYPRKQPPFGWFGNRRYSHLWAGETP